MTATSEELNAALQEHMLSEASKRRRTGAYPANRASAIDWPCPSGDRYAVLIRQHAPPLCDPAMQLIYEQGELQEKHVSLRLQLDGWRISDPLNKTVAWPRYQLTGHLDRLGQLPPEVAERLGLDPLAIYPLEIKSMSPYIWEAINSVGDLMKARQAWLRKYVGQLVLYLWLEEKPSGIFVFLNKSTGMLKFFIVHMGDWMTKATELLDRCARVNRHIAEDTCPEVTGYEESVCSRCDMKTICLPGEAGEGALPFPSDEMAEALERREELRPLAKEYGDLDDFVKAQAKRAAPNDKENSILLCSDWELRVNRREQHYKALPERDLQVCTVAIRRLKGASNDAGTRSD